MADWIRYEVQKRNDDTGEWEIVYTVTPGYELHETWHKFLWWKSRSYRVDQFGVVDGLVDASRFAKQMKDNQPDHVDIRIRRVSTNWSEYNQEWWEFTSTMWMNGKWRD